jgi:hypothetical protein
MKKLILSAPVQFLYSNLFLLLGFLFITGTTFAQDNARVVSAEWLPLNSTNEVDVFYKTIECLNPQSGIDHLDIYLQFVNKTDEEITFSWQKELQYPNYCLNCDGENTELQHQTTLSPKQSISGECGDAGDSNLRIVAKMLNVGSKTVLTNFKIKNITQL